MLVFLAQRACRSNLICSSFMMKTTFGWRHIETVNNSEYRSGDPSEKMLYVSKKERTLVD